MTRHLVQKLRQQLLDQPHPGPWALMRIHTTYRWIGVDATLDHLLTQGAELIGVYTQHCPLQWLADDLFA